MKTTTVRFDTETWADIVRQSEALGIAHAEFIRGAVRRRLGRLADSDRLEALEEGVERLTNRLDATTLLVARIASAAGLTKRPLR